MSWFLWMTAPRISQACDYFAHSQLTVREVAELCGYSNQFYFSKAFKQITSMSPSEYRGVHDNRYHNIFNILNDADFVTYVPPYDWGFDKYGLTLSFPKKGSAAYQQDISLVAGYFQTYTKVAFEEQDPAGVRLMTWLLTIGAKNSAGVSTSTMNMVPA